MEKHACEKNTLKCILRKISYVHGITEANYGDLKFTIHCLLFLEILILADVTNCFVAKHTKFKKLRNYLSVIKNY
jgi:hypothetical protein